MKKIVSLFFLILFISVFSGEPSTTTLLAEETHYLKLRANPHHEFLRIVLEGTEPVISKALVNQQGKDILVRFPTLSSIIQEEKASVDYKTNKDVIQFSPGNFKKFRASYLKDPSRLVIDVYLEAEHPENDAKIFPESARTRIERIKTIIIDPGHGGYESGITSGDDKEKNVALNIAKRLKVLINRGSTKCLLTRESDQFMSLSERVKFANNREADIFLSLHIGKHRDIVLYTPLITEPMPSYIRTFMLNKGQEGFLAKTDALSNVLQRAIKEDLGDDMVSKKPLPYSILSKIEAAALIIELPSLEGIGYTVEFETKLANTVYKGIHLYESKAAN